MRYTKASPLQTTRQSPYPRPHSYNYSWDHKRGLCLCENVAADALSRLPNTGELLQINVVSLSADLYQKIVEGWEKDKKLQEIVSKLQQDGNSVKHYEWSTHQLMRKGKLVVGDDLQLKHELFKCFHESSQGGHSGVQATLKRISAQVYWKKMKKEVKEWVRTCVVCQRFKPELVQSPGLLQPFPIPERVWTHISMDFIDGLPMSKAFLDNVYKLHGLPKVIVSDRDTTEWSTEVVNRCVECYLRCMTGDKPKEWVQWVPLAEYWYNTSFHTSIKTTPYQVLYGQAPPAYVTYTIGDSANESVDRSLVVREAVIQLLKFHLLRVQDRMKVMADRKRTERVFGIDDLVLLKLQPYRQSTLRQHKHHKLAPKYYGPFKIIARIGEVAYKLDLPITFQIHLVFHVSQLKQFKGSVSQVSVTLPQCDSMGVIALEPVVVLDRRMAKSIELKSKNVESALVNKDMFLAFWVTGNSCQLSLKEGSKEQLEKATLFCSQRMVHFQSCPGRVGEFQSAATLQKIHESTWGSLIPIEDKDVDVKGFLDEDGGREEDGE
ncbi:retrotransposable element Tf2 [Tanacetum coccineum]